jgi:hypothetical protein
MQLPVLDFLDGADRSAVAFSQHLARLAAGQDVGDCVIG